MNKTPLTQKQNEVLRKIVDITNYYDANEQLAITITLNVKRISKLYDVNLSFESKEVQANICNKILKDIFGTHVIYIMVTEFTLADVWHCHGLIWKMSKLWKLEGFSKIRRLLGNIVVKNKVNKDWYDYCIGNTESKRSNPTNCQYYIYNDEYKSDSSMPRVMMRKHIKQNAIYAKEEIDIKFDEHDFNNYKLMKAKKHVLAAARMFRHCKPVVKKIKKNCIVI